MIKYFKELTTQDITSIINCLVVIITAIYAFVQYRATKKSNREIGLIKTFEYLQNRDFIVARRHVLRILPTKLFKDWDAEDYEYAETVCRNYDTACLMNERTGYKKNIKEIATKWHDSVKNCYKICEPLILKYRNERGEGFWNHFDKLYNEALNLETDNTDNLLK